MADSANTTALPESPSLLEIEDALDDVKHFIRCVTLAAGRVNEASALTMVLASAEAKLVDAIADLAAFRAAHAGERS